MLQAAIVGLGWWGSHIAQALEGSERVRVVSGFDPAANEAQARGFALARSFESLLADRDVEAVILATPHALHEAQALAAKVLAQGRAAGVAPEDLIAALKALKARA